MKRYTLDFQEIGEATTALVGGKGANLAKLAAVEGLHVPNGFCITTEAFKDIIRTNPVVNELQDELTASQEKNRNTETQRLAAKIRELVERITIPQQIANEIAEQLNRLGEGEAYAVRSSATAEDLATASFAGLQDTYLNVTGSASILKYISRCWASLFTDRAVSYRFQNGFDHREVHLSVVIQKMIFPDAAGIMFTADPISGNRKVVAIDASFGLGEALVSGIVTADNYKIRDGKIIDKTISSKKIAVVPAEHGGTVRQKISPNEQNIQTLRDEEIIVLERIGRKVVQHFGAPQDIEWCLADNVFYIVQSRPITTLFPLPEVNDSESHIYISVGHQQMMTDVMKPLGLSIHATMSRARMYNAGGRLFVDVAPMLQSPVGRKTMIDTMGQFDPLIKDALLTVMEQGEMIKVTEEENSSQDEKSKVTSAQGYRSKIKNDPAIVSALVEQSQKAIEALRTGIKDKSGLELMQFIADDIQQLQKRIGDPQNMAAILGPMDAATWLNEKINEWLGEKNVSDAISQSVPNNITSEMGMALLDVADEVRPFPEVIKYLEQVEAEDFLNELKKLRGGSEVYEAITSFLAKYGMRCAGEIDITRTRWTEKPSILVPIILTNIKSFRPGESKRKFDQGLNEALNKEQDLLRRLRLLPDGEAKANEVQSMISFIRNFSGYREYPKYAIVSHYFIYRQALLEEAELLVKANIIRDKADIYYLSFEELRDVIAKRQVDQGIIDNRKQEYKAYEKLTPPRVITSDGEMINGKYNRQNLPAGAIAGLAVSSGIIEGRARVILSMEDADIVDGDILVTSFTDPSWTPLFVSIKGLVTEVGGLMTHGAVIAREYGLPAVVGVDNATRVIKDGQRIRVNGTDGFVEVL